MKDPKGLALWGLFENRVILEEPDDLAGLEIQVYVVENRTSG